MLPLPPVSFPNTVQQRDAHPEAILIEGVGNMVDFQTLFVTVENGIGTITINRPEVRNALSRQVVSELQKALEMCRHDSEVKVVVFTGAGDKSFVAGADIRELREWTLFEGLAAAMQELCNE